MFRVKSDRNEPFLKILANPLPGDFYESYSRDEDDIATFELRQYFENELKSAIQLTGNVIHPDACKLCRVDFYEFFGNPPVASFNERIFDSFYLCIGTVPEWKKLAFDLEFNTFENYLNNTRILSYYPISESKKILPDQKEMMYILWPNSAFQNIEVEVEFMDGTTETDSNPHLQVQPLQVASFSVGYQALDIAAINPEKTVRSYTVSIAGQSRTFVLDYKSHRQVRYLYFRNSLGGFDTLACTGEADEFTEVERKQSNRVYGVDAPLRYAKSEFYNEHIETVKVNTGWLSPAEKNWLNDLLISKEVYEQRGKKLQKVLIKNKSIDRSWRIYEPGSIEIEFERVNLVI